MLRRAASARLGRRSRAGGCDRGEPLDDSDDLDEDDDDPDRWLYVWPKGSRRAYDDMVDFTATRESRALAVLLERALEGRGAFRRFKDALMDWPEDREDWFVFSEDRRRGRAREWLADAGYRAAVHANPTGSNDG